MPAACNIMREGSRNLSSLSARLFHWGLKKCNVQPFQMPWTSCLAFFDDLFAEIYKLCSASAPKKPFKFKYRLLQFWFHDNQSLPLPPHLGKIQMQERRHKNAYPACSRWLHTSLCGNFRRQNECRQNGSSSWASQRLHNRLRQSICKFFMISQPVRDGNFFRGRLKKIWNSNWLNDGTLRAIQG